MKRILVLSLLAVLTLASCKKNEAAETSTATTSTTEQKDPFADDRVVKQSDLVSEAKNHAETTLALSEPDFNFGKIKKGDVVEHVYEVTNTGKNPLIISAVKPGCGCTAPDYTKEPIMPGQKGKITLKFDSTNFDGVVYKSAEVYANVSQVPIEIRFSADIQP
ncbi:DUF1573 domain-containing protein [Cloacibacterium caeni]|uniref:DUF1573 domain-containing protein n=1 Tax=Cloacibacterium caeni TaxID=2004710 RepID=UPI001BCE6CDE|nr:DUF1573 domain-containing protein [Cloacibacterium caeni]